MWRYWHPKTKRKQLIPGEATFLMIVGGNFLSEKKESKERRKRETEGEGEEEGEGG